MPIGKMYSSKKPLTVIAKKPPTRIQRIAKDVARLKKQQKKSEFKFNDRAISLTTPLAGGSAIQALDGIANGTLANNSIGDQYTVRSLQVDITLTPEVGGTAVSDQFVRIAIVRYKSMNNDTPSYGPAGGSNNIYEADNVYSPRELTNRNDFIIMKEWDITLDTSRQLYYRLKYYKKLNIVTTIDATTSSIEENGYFLVMFSNIDNVEIVGNCRIRFTDD